MPPLLRQIRSRTIAADHQRAGPVAPLSELPKGAGLDGIPGEKAFEDKRPPFSLSRSTSLRAQRGATKRNRTPVADSLVDGCMPLPNGTGRSATHSYDKCKTGGTAVPANFNSLMDQLFWTLPQTCCATSNHRTIRTNAFVDDLVRLDVSPVGLQNLIYYTMTVLRECVMARNNA